MRLVKHIACLHLQLKDKTQSSECSERENFFEKMIGRLYEANICLSNLIFLSLICPPPTFMCMLFVPRFFPGRRLRLCFYRVDAPANRRGVFGDGRPSIVLETPKPDF